MARSSIHPPESQGSVQQLASKQLIATDKKSVLRKKHETKQKTRGVIIPPLVGGNGFKIVLIKSTDQEGKFLVAWLRPWTGGDCKQII